MWMQSPSDNGTRKGLHHRQAMSYSTILRRHGEGSITVRTGLVRWANEHRARPGDRFGSEFTSHRAPQESLCEALDNLRVGEFVQYPVVHQSQDFIWQVTRKLRDEDQAYVAFASASRDARDLFKQRRICLIRAADRKLMGFLNDDVIRVSTGGTPPCAFGGLDRAICNLGAPVLIAASGRLRDSKVRRSMSLKSTIEICPLE